MTAGRKQIRLTRRYQDSFRHFWILWTLLKNNKKRTLYRGENLLWIVISCAVCREKICRSWKILNLCFARDPLYETLILIRGQKKADT